MEDIHIYSSVRKYSIFISFFLVFSAIGVYSLTKAPSDTKLWIGTLISCFGGLFMLYLILKERLAKKPFLIITDKGIIINVINKWEVSFADVDEFYLKDMASVQLICIRYKENIAIKKMNKAGWFERIIRRFNHGIQNSQESFPAHTLNMKAKELCNLLNNRLNTYHERCSKNV